MATIEFEQVQPAGLFRRLAAMLYDGMLLLALWFVLGWIAVYFHDGVAAPAPLMQFLCFTSATLFFVGFWMRDGRTLGMLAWRLQLVPQRGDVMTLRMAMFRLLGGVLSLSFFGLGIFWMLWDPEKRMWHDILSNTRIILRPRGQAWS